MSTSPYNAAGKLLNQILQQKKSIKTVAFSKSKLTCSKATYATVCNTIQNKSNIDAILNHNGGKLRKAIEMDKARNTGLVYVLLYELLFGPYGNIRGGGKLKRSIIKHEKALRETKNSVVKNSDIKSGSVTFPRYVRVNKLKATTEEIVKVLQKELGKGDNKKENSKDIYVDPHVPDLLVLSPKSSIAWHELDIVKEGKIILQDKSSCFSALALAHGSASSVEGDVIDACAAPGNKTSHVASLLYDQKKGSKSNKKCKVLGFDRSSARLTILKNRMSELAPLVGDDMATIRKSKFPVAICPTHQDFLKADPSDKMFKDVKSILLDPSCSGSGIVNQPDRLGESSKEKDNERIESLSNFQLLALKHAMSFPKVDRIVYSTCSVHQRENEDVVAAAMQEANEEIEDESNVWTLVAPVGLKDWKRRGIKNDDLTEDQSNCLIRVNGLDGDETNGFFVSYFERKKVVDANKGVKAKSLISIPKGVKGIYNGEFKVKLSTKKQDVKGKGGKKKDSKTLDENNTLSSEEVQKKETKASEAKNNKVIPKKAAKKLAWKRKQMQQKLERLKKQNAVKSSKNDKETA